MPCTVTAINQLAKSCIDALGSLKGLSLIERGDVTGATVAAGKISAIAVSGSWVEFNFDKDKTAYLTLTTERPSLFRSHYVIDGLVKFADPTDDDIVAMNNLDCCDLVAVAVSYTGRAIVLGIQINRAGDDVEDAIVTLKVNGNLHFPAGDEEARIEFMLVGQQKNTPPYTGDLAAVGITFGAGS